MRQWRIPLFRGISTFVFLSKHYRIFSLGRTTIPATIIDLEKTVRGEYAENTFRKQFTPSECADIADALEPVERALARERQLAGKPPEKFSEGGEARHKIAKAAGRSAPSIAKARAVRDAEPEKFGKLQADMMISLSDYVRRRATPICSAAIATTKNGIAMATRRRQPKRMPPNDRATEIVGAGARRRSVRPRRDLPRARP